MEHKPYGPYETYFKRPLDILCALAALIVFGWLYILVAVLVRIMLGSPVIFKQPRPGRDEKIFDLYKFRSMTDERDEVRPGLSGYAQVHGRNTVSWQDKFEMDVKYVDHITFLGDLKIIWGSVMAAFVRRGGISSETSVTMEEFMGNGMVAK